MKTIKKISTILDLVSSTFAGVLVVILSTFTLTGVFYRFILDRPIVWLYEFTIVSFSWMIFLGMAMAFKKHEHIALSFVVTALPPKVQYYWRQGIYAICLVFLAVAIFGGFNVVRGTWGQMYNTIPLSRGLFYLSMPVGAFVSIFHILSEMIELKVGDPVDGSLSLLAEELPQMEEEG